ncbi:MULTISPECIES: molybdopterin molybdotransferase MoeA [unclassified Janthinobacterium]|uniref:molybdopterin molybdotransferase MoeA n=1 Tax=unclassified Janthinobacterium TaxID=2610881 RepID=UPI00034C6E82|nr:MULTISPECIES: gephyrin-like molybdotransferase Glp [unclassified Janthinobacterium]MEC5162213.1 molybdopterin molybdotransferase [Janthinobacterium sp. CG_S6]
MIDKHNITGLILAGGRGTRMGRVDKGLMPLRGATMAAQVLRTLAPQVGALAINANQNLATYETLGVPVWPDELGGFEGPLAGLHSGLRRCNTEFLVSVPCDSPFLPDDLVARLAAALLAEDADLAVAVTLESDPDGAAYEQTHAVFCLLKTSALPTLSAYLDGGGRRMQGWYGDLAVARVRFDQTEAFRNINTPEQLRSAEAGMAAAAQAATPAPPAGQPGAAALSVRAAQRLIEAAITPIRSSEQVALRSALDRVLAADIISPINVPAHDNSAMDGYAVRGADLRADGPTTLAIVATVYAGHPAELAIGPGQCARIMTGAVMPAGCDSVVPQELVSHADAAAVTIPAGAIRAGDNRRLKGEDLLAGSPALKKGKIIRPAELGLLASLGVAEAPVQRRLRVAFFSTGDELRSIGEPLDAGCVYDSNRYTLFGMLNRLGCDVIDMGIVQDQPAALEAALRSACENADAVITSGGVSSGEADYTRQIMARLGQVDFWRIDMRPGRPMAFGQISSNGRSAFLLGLPGNPVAVMVTFYFFARVALLRMMGADAAPPPLLRVRSRDPIRKRPGRTEFQRGILGLDAAGLQEVRVTGSQGSGILRSMSEANCMVVLHDEQGNVGAGDAVDVMLFDGLV